MDSPVRDSCSQHSLTGRSRTFRWRVRDLWRSLRGGPGHGGPASDHFDGERFFNPHGFGPRSFADFVRWRWTATPAPWPTWVENAVRPQLPESLEAGQIAFTFINHITFLIQFRGLNVLTDPVYAERASPFRRIGPRRVRAPGLPFDDLPHIDVVLVSHNHYDHLDLETLTRLHRTHRPRFITGLGNRAFLEQFGITRVEELDWWESLQAGAGNFTMVPAQHWSARSGSNRNRTLWGGFVVGSDGRQVLFAGDTAYGGHFNEMRRRLGPIDIAMLPIGAYEPRWFMSSQHMDPEEAVRAHRELRAMQSIATHFGCFRLTDEGLEDPVSELAAARERHGVAVESFLALETGQTHIFPGNRS